MNIINFIKSIFGIKPKEKKPTFYLEVLSDSEVNLIGQKKPYLDGEVVTNELNQVTLKIGSDITPKIKEPTKPKKKKYHKKKTNTKVSEAPKEVTPTKTTKDGINQKHLDKIRQFNIKTELGDEFEAFMIKINLSEDEVGELCQLVERVTTQHYVRQLLNRELL